MSIMAIFFAMYFPCIKVNIILPTRTAKNLIERPPIQLLRYYWLSVSQSLFLSGIHLGPKTRFLLTSNSCWCWAPSLTRGWVCRLSLLLALASAVMLNSRQYYIRFGPPLWSSGSSWLQIQCPGFDSRHYQIVWELVGLQWGPLSLVSTIEKLLERKSCFSGLENRDYGRRGFAALNTRDVSIRKSWHYLRRQAVVSRSV
jgi:hypothetical protein